METNDTSHPVLSCADAQTLESKLLSSASAEWTAMQRAGRSLAQAALLDYTEIGAVPEHLRVCALVGKGHNGGDALIACAEFLALYPRAKVSLLMTASVDDLKPLARRAYDQLLGRVTTHVIQVDATEASVRQLFDQLSDEQGFHLCVDGLMGMAFHPPLRAPMDAMISAINGYGKIDLRLSVDLPSGLGDQAGSLLFRADFTYATGIVKRPVLQRIEAGRVRSLDLGFFQSDCLPDVADRVLTASLLNPFRAYRPAESDKRQYGHVFIVGGSTSMPGALLMSAQAAVRSGAGRVTVFAPESVTPYLCAQLPEAMWVGWPETENGRLCPTGLSTLWAMMDRATVLVVGPGMGVDSSTQQVVEQIISQAEVPLLLDADALQAEVLDALKKRTAFTVLTPHAGEFMRLSGTDSADISNETLRTFCQVHGVCTVLKGTHTRICPDEPVFWNLSGGPILARGGSGDLLSGLIGGLLARPEVSPLESVQQGVSLHGLAADAWARAKGAHFVRTTDLLDYLPEVVRGV